MSPTRLLVLGTADLPAGHGYLVRRELMSWRVDQWAAVHPGSATVAGQDLLRAPREVRRRIGYVGQGGSRSTTRASSRPACRCSGPRSTTCSST